MGKEVNSFDEQILVQRIQLDEQRKQKHSLDKLMQGLSIQRAVHHQHIARLIDIVSLGTR